MHRHSTSLFDMSERLSEHMFIKCSENIMKKTAGLNTQTTIRRFKSLFGIFPTSCAFLWDHLNTVSDFKGHPHHILWGLMFLKVYGSEQVHASLAGCHEDTFRKWIWHFIEIVFSMTMVTDEYIGATGMWKNCVLSIDGTDVPIEEPTTFSTSWYSHKFSGPGLRYELGVSIKSGNICWVNGPFPCGSNPDDKIFLLGLLSHLKKGECVVADRGYKHSKCVTPDTRLFDSDDTVVYQQILARHETVNRLLKLFFILSHRFRYSIQKHRICFMAVVNIVTLCIKNGLVRTFDI